MLSLLPVEFMRHNFANSCSFTQQANIRKQWCSQEAFIFGYQVNLNSFISLELEYFQLLPYFQVLTSHQTVDSCI